MFQLWNSDVLKLNGQRGLVIIHTNLINYNIYIYHLQESSFNRQHPSEYQVVFVELKETNTDAVGKVSFFVVVVVAICKRHPTPSKQQTERRGEAGRRPPPPSASPGAGVSRGL